MKFALFNLAVVAALAYLFMMERDDRRDVVERVEQGLQQVEELATESLTPASETPAEPVKTPAAEADEDTVLSSLAPSTADLLAELPPLDDPAVERRRQEILADLDLPVPAPASSTADQTAAPSAPPQVVLAEGESLMTPRERVKQLNALAEEMELLFVQSLSE